MRFDGPRSLTAAQQYINLQTNPDSAGTGRLHSGRLTWAFPVSPTSLSRTYSGRLEYVQGGVPEVFIDAPDLNEIADGRPLPHVYQQAPPRLCLYLPGSGEWRPSLRLDQTVVPWTALWLFYFEEWVVSDQWAGGGLHPPDSRETAGISGSQSKHRKLSRKARVRK